MPDPAPAPLPAPPYYVVVFTSVRTPGDDGYGKRAEEMLKLAAEQPGFLGVDSARDPGGLGITVSYWRDEESIAGWREHTEHTLTRAYGRERWYKSFTVHVARVERGYGYTRPDAGAGQVREPAAAPDPAAAREPAGARGTAAAT
ncbi:antibiotic biosynthesis monooxygenase [Streptomyces sp. B1866]|uniref:antibiotic biosynthesis monooxygenase family protein n=1 Tax=Streptomyces sp. B1866 TaxID=3075431 RepID=UPI0028921325|nr:antibiotic biosynthesis monooxygenase [Streptomyces sp. B1866]MDT3396455.1 antibiotic biosynthesis monooxygenase [Streptomyces sp. B1866]